MLGFGITFLASRPYPPVVAIHHWSTDLGTSDLAERNSEIVQTTQLDGCVVLLDPQVCEAGENDVENAVFEG